MTQHPAQSVGSVELAVFVVELGLLAVFAVAGGRTGEGVFATVLAVLLPLVAASIWGLYLAPRAGHRLRYPSRLVAKLVLFVIAAALLAASGLPVWAGAFLVVAGAVVSVGESRGAAADADV